MPWICRTAEVRERLATERIRREAAEALAADERRRRVALERQLDQGNDRERGQPLPEKLLSYLSLAGLLLYGVAVFGYRVCYETIGVDPEEAGLSYSQIVTQAALGTTVLVVAVILLLMSGFPLERRLATQQGQFFAFYIVVATAIFALSINGGRRISLIGLTVIIVISVPMGIWALRRKLERSLILVGVLLFLASLIVAPIVIGKELANGIKAGKTETPISLVGLLRVRARLVQVTWTNDTPEWANSSRLYSYLGEAGGIVILYDLQSCRVHRVSLEGMGDVALSTVPQSQEIVVPVEQATGGPPADCGASS